MCHVVGGEEGKFFFASNTSCRGDRVEGPVEATYKNFFDFFSFFILQTFLSNKSLLLRILTLLLDQVEGLESTTKKKHLLLPGYLGIREEFSIL